MKEFLKRVKLCDHLTTELQILKSEFVKELKNHVDDGETGIFSDSFDMFSSSKNEYKGKINIEGFKIKRKRKFFDMNLNMAVASGKYEQKGETLTIETEINGFNTMMILFYVFCILIYSVLLIGFLTADEIGGNMPRILALPFLLFHAALVMGIPYLMLRRSTQRLKRELEREFYYVTKK
jgi:hypothetical protein